MAADTALDPARIVATVAKLRDRIRERFPDASLANVAVRLLGVARETARRTAEIRRPNHGLRIGIAVLIALAPAALVYEILTLDLRFAPERLGDFIALFQGTLESLVFIGAGIVFLVTLESRIKRGRALDATQELRVLAHLVDMHQLTKDPVYLLAKDGRRTDSSPKREMTPFELNRYLDYSSEMLSLIGKVAALYAQHLSDPVALGAVDQIESLTTGFARKIWQKVMLLERAAAG